MDSSLIPNIELFIAQVQPFNHLPKALISQVANHIDIRYIPKGNSILDQENAEHNFLYIIRIGEVEQKKENGELRARLETGSIFGFSINAKDTDKYTAYALENTLIYQISYEFLNELLAQYPDYAVYFSSDASTRLYSASKSALMQDRDDILMRKVSEVANPKIAIIDAHATIQQAAIEMCQQRRSSALIMENNHLIGIVGDRDMTKKVVAKGIPVSQPVTEIMTVNPPVISANDLVLNAISLMMQHNIRNLPVISEDGNIQGILTATDLVKQNSIQSIFIINHIFQANTLSLLQKLAKQQNDVFAALVESGANYNTVMKIMTLIADAFTQKLLMMAEHQFGTPPCRYTWIVSGSQARYEMHLLSDQDSAIILERDITDEERQYFVQLTEFVTTGLAQFGYALCSGNYMASNPRWCQSLDKWKENFHTWILNPELEGLLNASVLMDMRAIFGDIILAEQLQEYFVDLTKHNNRFLAYMVANSIRVKPPLSIFKNFVLIKEGEHKNKLNLKKRAISLLVDLGRIYALAAGLPAAMSTEERFLACYKNGVIDKITLDNALGAYQFVCEVRFKYQKFALKEQQPITNHISPDELNAFERSNLKDAFRLIAKFQEAAELRFSQKGLIR